MRVGRLIVVTALVLALLGMPPAAAGPGEFFEFWEVGYHGPLGGDDRASSIEIGSDGSVYVSGSVANDVAAVKYSSDGALMWERQLGLPMQGRSLMKLDRDDNVYVAGTVIEYVEPSGIRLSVTKFDSAGNRLWDAASHVLTDFTSLADLEIDDFGNIYIAGYENRSTVIKFAPDGTQLWIDYPLAELHDLEVDATGNLHVTGNLWRTYYDTSFWTAKYDAGGTIIWEAKYDFDEDFDVAWAMTLDDLGNVYVAGMSIAGDAVIKYDAAGTELWTAPYAGPGWQEVKAIAVDDLGNVYVKGNSRLTPTSLYDCLTVKYSPSGETLWQDRYDPFGDEDLCSGGGLLLDADASVYVSAVSASGDPRNRDMATIIYDTNGARVWEGRYDGAAGGDDVPADIEFDDASNLYLVGSSETDTGLDIITIKYAQLNLTNALASLRLSVEVLDLPNGVEQALLAKLDQTSAALARGDDAVAANLINAFVAQVSGLSGGTKLTNAQAEALIVRADVLLDLLRD